VQDHCSSLKFNSKEKKKNVYPKNTRENNNNNLFLELKH